MDNNIRYLDGGIEALKKAKKHGKYIAKLADNGYSYAKLLIHFYEHEGEAFIKAMDRIIEYYGLWTGDVVEPEDLCQILNFHTEGAGYQAYAISIPIADESANGEENLRLEGFQHERGPFRSIAEALCYTSLCTPAVIIGIKLHWKYEILFISQEIDGAYCWKRYDPESHEHNHILYYGWAPNNKTLEAQNETI
jgi:hypothetical protein